LGGGESFIPPRGGGKVRRPKLAKKEKIVPGQGATAGKENSPAHTKKGAEKRERKGKGLLRGRDLSYCGRGAKWSKREKKNKTGKKGGGWPSNAGTKD